MLTKFSLEYLIFSVQILSLLLSIEFRRRLDTRVRRHHSIPSHFRFQSQRVRHELSFRIRCAFHVFGMNEQQHRCVRLIVGNKNHGAFGQQRNNGMKMNLERKNRSTRPDGFLKTILHKCSCAACGSAVLTAARAQLQRFVKQTLDVVLEIFFHLRGRGYRL